MRYAIHADDRADGSLHANELLTQRVVELAGAEQVEDADEVIFVLDGEGALDVEGERHPLRPGTAAFLARGTRWSAQRRSRPLSARALTASGLGAVRGPRPDRC